MVCSPLAWFGTSRLPSLRDSAAAAWSLAGRQARAQTPLSCWRSAFGMTGPESGLLTVNVSAGSATRSRLAAAMELSGTAWFTWVEGPNAAGGHIAATRLEEDGSPACGWQAGGNSVSALSDTTIDLPLVIPTNVGDAYIAWLTGNLPRATRMTSGGAIGATRRGAGPRHTERWSAHYARVHGP